MKNKIAFLLIAIIAGIAVMFGLAWVFLSDGDVVDVREDIQDEISLSGSSDEGPIAVQPNLDNRFGFLTGGMSSRREYEMVIDMNAEWIRPHPGPFVWGDMQKNNSSEIDFSETDDFMRDAGKEDVSILITLWPFAEWDQEEHPKGSGCEVEGEEFVRDFGSARCAPTDWDAYDAWVEAVVERYDGDGFDDMIGLRASVKYWEVMNEPDLQPPAEDPGGLQFWAEGPEEYADLLKHTYTAIKRSDPTSQVLISGAAGGEKDMLDFYRDVFEDSETHDAFDIANVHCISSGDIGSFNVAPYVEMLSEYGLDEHPLWVTEAEAYVSDDPQVNATQVRDSTQMAVDLGADRFFYTGMKFDRDSAPGGPPPDDKKSSLFGGEKEPSPPLPDDKLPLPEGDLLPPPGPLQSEMPSPDPDLSLGDAAGDYAETYRLIFESISFE